MPLSGNAAVRTARREDFLVLGIFSISLLAEPIEFCLQLRLHLTHARRVYCATVLDFGVEGSCGTGRNNQPLAAQLVGRASPRPAIAGPHTRPVKGNPLERHQPQFLADHHHLDEQITQLVRMLPPELRERGGIDGHALREPAKVKPHLERLFELATGPNAADQPVQNDGTQHPRMNGRLPERLMIEILHGTPVDASEDLIDNADEMVLVDGLIEPRGKQHHLIPITFRLSPTHNASPVLLCGQQLTEKPPLGGAG